MHAYGCCLERCGARIRTRSHIGSGADSRTRRSLSAGHACGGGCALAACGGSGSIGGADADLCLEKEDYLTLKSGIKHGLCSLIAQYYSDYINFLIFTKYLIDQNKKNHLIKK